MILGPTPPFVSPTCSSYHCLSDLGASLGINPGVHMFPELYVGSFPNLCILEYIFLPLVFISFDSLCYCHW